MSAESPLLSVSDFFSYSGSFSACINNNLIFFFCRLASTSILLGNANIVFTLRLRVSLLGTNPAGGIPVCGCGIATGFYRIFNSFKKTFESFVVFVLKYSCVFFEKMQQFLNIF